MLKIIKQVSFLLCVGVMTVFIVMALLLPDKYMAMMPYRGYHVLTNSMEPKIGVDDLVIVKSYHEGMKINKNDIITFRADRFGESIIITHRFSHTQISDDGTVIYKTHPEKTDVLDPYSTTQEDLLGVYVFHIPYMGKLVLFLKSRFGFLWFCEIIIIMLIKAIVKARWEEKSYQLTIES